MTDIPAEGNRDDHAFRWYSRLHGIGLSPGVARELYEAGFYDEAGGARPTNPGDLDDMIYRIWAGIAGDNPPGSEAPEAPSSIFGDAIKAHMPEPEFKLLGRSLLTRKELAYWDEDHNLPRAPNGFTGLQLGSHDAFKTVLNMSLYLDAKDKPRVLYCIGEGEDTMGALILAQCRARGISEDEFLAQIEFADVPLVDIPGLPYGAGIGNMKAFVDWLRATAEEFRPDIIHLDTYASMIAGRIGEMDDRAGAIFTRHGSLRQLARDRKALVMTTHHINREEGKQTDPTKIHSRGHTAPESNGDLILKQVRQGETIHLYRSRCRGGRGNVHFYYGIDRVGPAPDPLDNPPVACQISEAQFRLLTGAAESLSREKVHSALMTMGALDPAHSVSTLAVVMHMFPQERQELHDWQVGLNRMAGMLERAKEKLPGLWAAPGAEGTRWSATG
jgi:hypothetical protein